MALAEALLRELVGEVERHDLVHLGGDLGLLGFQAREEGFLGLEGVVSLLDVPGDVVRGEEEGPELLLEDGFEVRDGDLVPAGGADVLGAVGGHAHFGAADAVREAGEQVPGALGRGAAAGLAGGQQRRALVPEVGGDDGGHVGPDPVALGLEVPVLPVALGAGVVGAAGALGRGVEDEAGDGGIGPLGAGTRPVPPVVEEFGRGPLPPPGLQEDLVDEFADGGLGLVEDEATVLPGVSEGGGAPEALAHFGADDDRGGYPGGDLLALPLREGGDHGVEEPASRGGGVDRLLEADEVGPRLPEEVGEVEEFAGVSGQPSELAENEAADAVMLDVVEHPLALGVVLDRLPRNRVEAVHGDHVPSLEASVRAGAGLVVLRALALDLVLGGDAEPDADGAGGGGRVKGRLHGEPPGTGRRKNEGHGFGVGVCHPRAVPCAAQPGGSRKGNNRPRYGVCHDPPTVARRLDAPRWYRHWMRRRLSYFFNVTTQEPTTAAKDRDVMTVALYSLDGQLLRTFDVLGNGSAKPKGQYTKREFDVSAWIGQTVRLALVVRSVAPNPTVFRVDDFQVLVDGNLRPAGSPDMVIVGFSGFSQAASSDYLSDPVDALPALRAEYERSHPGKSCVTFGFVDNLYGDANHIGFLGAIDKLNEIGSKWIRGFSNPTRLCIVGHSHGATWAHLAAMSVQCPAVEFLIDLDSYCSGFDVGVIVDFETLHGSDISSFVASQPSRYAALGIDLTHPCLAPSADDLVPSNVATNLEVYTAVDLGSNHRLSGLGGTSAGIHRQSYATLNPLTIIARHGAAHAPGESAMNWVIEKLTALGW